MIWIYETLHAINRLFSFLAPMVKIEYRRFFGDSKVLICFINLHSEQLKSALAVGLRWNEWLVSRLLISSLKGSLFLFLC
jgi:hypothetical protein